MEMDKDMNTDMSKDIENENEIKEETIQESIGVEPKRAVRYRLEEAFKSFGKTKENKFRVYNEKRIDAGILYTPKYWEDKTPDKTDVIEHELRRYDGYYDAITKVMLKPKAMVSADGGSQGIYAGTLDRQELLRLLGLLGREADINGYDVSTYTKTITGGKLSAPKYEVMTFLNNMESQMLLARQEFKDNYIIEDMSEIASLHYMYTVVSSFARFPNYVANLVRLNREAITRRPSLFYDIEEFGFLEAEQDFLLSRVPILLAILNLDDQDDIMPRLVLADDTVSDQGITATPPITAAKANSFMKTNVSIERTKLILRSIQHNIIADRQVTVTGLGQEILALSDTTESITYKLNVLLAFINSSPLLLGMDVYTDLYMRVQTFWSDTSVRMVGATNDTYGIYQACMENLAQIRILIGNMAWDNTTQVIVNPVMVRNTRVMAYRLIDAFWLAYNQSTYAKSTIKDRLDKIAEQTVLWTVPVARLIMDLMNKLTVADISISKYLHVEPHIDPFTGGNYQIARFPTSKHMDAIYSVSLTEIPGIFLGKRLDKLPYVERSYMDVLLRAERVCEDIARLNGYIKMAMNSSLIDNWADYFGGGNVQNSKRAQKRILEYWFKDKDDKVYGEIYEDLKILIDNNLASYFDAIRCLEKTKSTGMRKLTLPGYEESPIVDGAFISERQIDFSDSYISRFQNRVTSELNFTAEMYPINFRVVYSNQTELVTREIVSGRPILLTAMVPVMNADNPNRTVPLEVMLSFKDSDAVTQNGLFSTYFCENRKLVPSYVDIAAPINLSFRNTVNNGTSVTLRTVDIDINTPTMKIDLVVATEEVPVDYLTIEAGSGRFMAPKEYVMRMFFQALDANNMLKRFDTQKYQAYKEDVILKSPYDHDYLFVERQDL
jgi:hypothetical protein